MNTAPKHAPLLVTIQDAARMLAISRSALCDLIWNGQVKPVHIGRSVRFAVTELERFVAGRSQSESDV
ncbi:MAG TPA: helix-turn-helix domain-containing protein [Ilumatobacter sp.]|nr:helix-turn-helix domain-containing protein [Ilumatobacter sp.]